MNHNDCEKCGVNCSLVWLLCKLAAENKVQELELNECYDRITELTAQNDKLYVKLNLKKAADE